MLKHRGKLIVTFPAPDHYLLKNKIKKYTYKIKYHERKNMEICAPSLAYLLKKFKDYNFKIDGIYKYSHGRKLLLKGKDNLKNIDYTNNLFSMYGFCITKK